MSDLVLYNYFRSSASFRVRIALHLKNLPFEYKPVHLLNNGGEQHTAQYQSLNPAAEVPTLIHKGKTLSQSMAILQYLDEVYPEKKVFPQDVFQRAKVMQFCEGINCTQSIQNLKVLQYLENDLKVSTDQKDEWLKHWVGKNLESSERQIQSTAGTYCFGDDVTAADLFLVPQLFVAARFSMPTEKYPTLMKVAERCSKLEAFQKAHPFHQPDTPEELRPKV